jgi:hypothetical protein
MGDIISVVAEFMVGVTEGKGRLWVCSNIAPLGC